MPRYSVIVTRDVTESVAIEVVAKSSYDAELNAREYASDNPHIQWEREDGNFHLIYSNGAELVDTVTYQTKADLMSRPAWRHLDVDSSGNPCAWLNYYDGFEDVWSCQCDSDGETPTHSEWIGPLDAAELALWESLPDAS